jgi:hypothetical protein
MIKIPLERELCNVEPKLCENGVLIRIAYENTIEAMDEFSEELVMQTRKATGENIQHRLEHVQTCYAREEFAFLYTSAIDYLRDSLSSLSGGFSPNIHYSVRLLNFILPPYLIAELNFLADMEICSDTACDEKTVVKRNAMFAKSFFADYLNWFKKKIVLQEWNVISGRLNDLKELIGTVRQQRIVKQIGLEMKRILVDCIALKCTEIKGTRFRENDVVDSLNLFPNDIALETLRSSGFDVEPVAAFAKEMGTILSEEKNPIEKHVADYFYNKLKNIAQCLKPIPEENFNIGEQ